MPVLGETIKIGHLEVESPWGNAGGVVKNTGEVGKMALAGVGWIEAGSFTLLKNLGNGPSGEITYVHDKESGRTWNSKGMDNPGFDAVEPEIPKMADIAHENHKPLIVNVAPVSDKPIWETYELVLRAYEAGADGVLINAGCHNIVTKNGGRKLPLSHSPEKLYRVLLGLTEVVHKFNKVFVRLSPIEDARLRNKTLNSVLASGTASTIFTPNTWNGHKPPDHLGQLEVAGGTGSLSGPATADDAWKQTFYTAINCPSLDIVSSGGIVDGKELHRRLWNRMVPNVKAGAGTTFFMESIDWPEDVSRLIHQYMETSESDNIVG